MMRYRWDGDAGALYVFLTDAPIVRQVEVVPNAGVILDVDADDNPVGVEFLNPKESDLMYLAAHGLTEAQWLYTLAVVRTRGDKS